MAEQPAEDLYRPKPTIAVIGSESTGTRLITRLVDGEHFSFPNGSFWPENDIRALEPTHILVCVRDWYASLRSKMKFTPIDIAESEQREAYIRIFTMLGQMTVPWMTVTYESAITCPRTVSEEISAFIGRQVFFHEAVQNGNEKWYHDRSPAI